MLGGVKRKLRFSLKSKPKVSTLKSIRPLDEIEQAT